MVGFKLSLFITFDLDENFLPLGIQPFCVGCYDKYNVAKVGKGLTRDWWNNSKGSLNIELSLNFASPLQHRVHLSIFDHVCIHICVYVCVLVYVCIFIALLLYAFKIMFSCLYVTANKYVVVDFIKTLNKTLNI